MADPSPIDVLEALLFASDTPLEPERIREVVGLGDVAEAKALVEELRARVDTSGRALQITDVAGGYRMVTRPEVAPWLVRLARSRTRARLSRPALETLAIVGYRQPVSRPEIDAIRGVNSEGVLDSLLERRLVRISGRKEAPGRPFLYETTREFLVAFGLRDVAELPKVEGELVVPDLGGPPTSADGGDTGAEDGDTADTETADAAAATDAGALGDSAADVANAEGDAADATATVADVEHAVADVTATAASASGPDEQSQAEQAPGPGGPHVETGR